MSVWLAGGLDGDCRRRESYCSIRFFKAWLFAHGRRSGFAAVVAHDGAHSVYLRENECITISWQVETLDRERPEIALGWLVGESATSMEPTQLRQLRRSGLMKLL